MVKAGVYLIARTLPLFGGIDIFVNILIYVGILSAIWASLRALIEIDIKKILAYSTISQIGFLFVVLGSKNIFAASFHLLNHALFKGLLFLAAGVVVHSLKTRSIIKLGGLWKRMPFTFVVFTIGALSLAALPPFGGFWSKDLVLASIKQGPVFFAAAIVSLITAMYAFRMVFWIFLRKPSKEVAHHEVHEPKIMILACALLAITCILTSFVDKPLAEFMGGVAEYSHVLLEYSTFLTLLGFAVVVYHGMYHKKIEQIGLATLAHDVLKIDLVEHAYHRVMHIGAIVFLEKEYEELEHIAADLLHATWKKIKIQVPMWADWLWDTFEIKLIEKSTKNTVNIFTRIHNSVKKIITGHININVLLLLMALLALVMFS